MKTFIVYEYPVTISDTKNSTGCWTCWWKTPGKCIFKDLDFYYQKYIIADKVIFFLETKKGFVSSKVKTIFDRMILLFLPYSHFHTGESMHAPRYKKHPKIQVIYRDDFINNKEKQVFEAYIHRTFYQFYSQDISVISMKEHKEDTHENNVY